MTDSHTFAGSASLCYRVDDLDRAIQFYSALGLKVVPEVGLPGQSCLVRRGGFSIFLMTFGVDSLNFRGIDAFDVQAQLSAAGVSINTDAPTRNPDGGSTWLFNDPDGHGVFINTHGHEMTDAHRSQKIVEVLRAALQDLTDLECDDAIVAQVRSAADMAQSTPQEH